jgi:hypothetical protein
MMEVDGLKSENSRFDVCRVRKEAQFVLDEWNRMKLTHK